MNTEEYKAKAKEYLAKLNSDEKYDYDDDALELIREYERDYDRDFNIVDDYLIDEIVKKDVNEYGWDRVACFLANAELNPPYGHRIDAYGNLQNIDLDDIKLWLEDIIND